MDQIFDKMESGEAWLAPYYSGDAGTLVENNENIKFIVPEEGTNYFVDAMCIPATAEHKKEAELYINFMCDPEISEELSIYFYLRSCYIISRLRFCFFQMMMAM